MKTRPTCNIFINQKKETTPTMSAPTTISIDNVEYVRKDQTGAPAEQVDGLDYVIVRANGSGVWAGYLEIFDTEDEVAVLKNARRMYYWSGAATLSQLAIDGTSKPTECKFPVEVGEVTVTKVLEVINVTEKARKSIASVKVWSV